MSTPATTTEPQAPATCESCGAPLADDQRYCLHCGEPRAAARRQLPAAVRPAPAPSTDARLAMSSDARELREGPSVAAVLAGLACLLVAVGIGVLIGRGGGEQVAQAPLTVAAPAAQPVAASFASDWPAGTDGWTVALVLLPKATTTTTAVAAAKTAATGKGAADVGALDADAYPSLTGGSYVVYSGVFDSEHAATAARVALTAAYPAARVVRVGQATAAAGGAAAKPAATSTTASGSSGAKKSSGADTSGADTTKEFEKSKKAPKTVGTGGTPPPKDDKPAAGGGGFEDIG
jgi:hypothetical protein